MRVILTVEIGEQRLLKTELERLEVVQTLGDHTRCSLEFIRDRGTDLTLEQVLAWDPVVEAIAAQAPNWEPGSQHG